MKRLSKEDRRLIKFGPQFYLPHEVLRHVELMKILEENGIEVLKKLTIIYLKIVTSIDNLSFFCLNSRYTA